MKINVHFNVFINVPIIYNFNILIIYKLCQKQLKFNPNSYLNNVV